MSLSHSPQIISSGLVFAYDMGNTQKSWRGRPVTNQFTLPSDDVNGFGVQNSTFTRVRQGNYAGYEIKSTDYVWKYNVSANDCPYHGWDISTPSGTVVTFSFDFYVDSSTTNYPITNFLANMENAGSGVSASLTDTTSSVKGVWKSVYFSSTATATGNSRCLLYPGACGGRLGDAGFILYKNPQVEFNAPGSVPSPFVAGTRSNTQAIIDHVGNNTITASDLTYNSDGTFSFNGSSNYITPSGITDAFLSTSWSMSFWAKFTSVNKGSDNALFGHGAASQNNGLHLGERANYAYFGFYSNDLSGTVALGANVWKNITFTYNSSTKLKTIYVNGVFDTSGGTVGYTGTGSNPIIGMYPWATSYKMSGSIANTQIYNRTLTAAEVQQNFNALRGRYGI